MSKDARSAIAVASRLVREGIDGAQAAAELGGIGGGIPALLEAADYLGQRVSNGYPVTSMHRLLLVAAGEPAPAPSEDAAAVESRQRQLSMQPFSVSFQQLAEQVRALRDLEQRARSDPKSFLRELSPLERLLVRPRARDARQQVRITIGMRKVLQRLLGPSSRQTDPVLSSRLAVNAAARHLWEVAGIDPNTWGPSDV